MNKKFILFIFLINTQLIQHYTLLATSVVAPTSPILGTYYENWAQYRTGAGAFTPTNLSQIVSKITDLSYAFAFFNYNTQTPNQPVTGDWKIYFTEWNDAQSIASINAYKNSNPNFKRVFLSIGGWSFNDPTSHYGSSTSTFFSQLVAAGQGSTQWNNFIASAISTCQQYNLQGIDLDWEYPGVPSRGGNAQDYNNYALFLSYLGTQLHNNGLYLTLAVPSIAPSGYVNGTYNTNVQVDTSNPQTYINFLGYILQFVDWFNLMTYDYYGAFPGQTITDDNSPLYPRTTGLFSVTGSLTSFDVAGMPHNKLVVGVPAYGRTFASVQFPSPQAGQPYAAGCPFSAAGAPGYYTQQAGMLSFFEIQGEILDNIYIGTATNTTTQTAYAWNTNYGGIWASYDSPSTTYNKGTIFLNQGYLGGFIYAVDLDNFQDQISPYAITNALASGLGIK